MFLLGSGVGECYRRWFNVNVCLLALYRRFAHRAKNASGRWARLRPTPVRLGGWGVTLAALLVAGVYRLHVGEEVGQLG